MTSTPTKRTTTERLLGVKQPSSGGVPGIGKPILTAVLFILALAGITLLVSKPNGQSDLFPDTLKSKVLAHETVDFAELATEVSYFCLVGGYHMVDDFLSEKGIRAETSVYVSENDFVLALEMTDGSLEYAYFDRSDSHSTLRQEGCFTANNHAIEFQEKQLSTGGSYFDLVVS